MPVESDSRLTHGAGTLLRAGRPARGRAGTASRGRPIGAARGVVGWLLVLAAVFVVARSRQAASGEGIALSPRAIETSGAHTACARAVGPGDHAAQVPVARVGAGGGAPRFAVGRDATGAEAGAQAMDGGVGAGARDRCFEVIRIQSTAAGLRIVRYVQSAGTGQRSDLEDMTTIIPRSVNVALTFDDGPHPRWTPLVLDALDKHAARATFFVLGVNAKRWPELVSRAAAAGHEIACHTYGHPHLTRLSDQAIERELGRFAQVVLPLTTDPPVWLRPPYGSVDGRVRRVVGRLGYRVALWDVDTNDWRKPSAQTIASRILAGARNGKVILMHDGGGDRSRTVEALRIALPKLVERGVRLVTLSQLKGLKPLPPEEIVIVSNGRQWVARAAKVTVVVDGRQVDQTVRAFRCDGTVLLEAGRVLQALDVPYQWDSELRALRVESVHGRIILRGNSRRATIGERKLWLLYPVVALKGRLYASAQLLGRICNCLVRVAGDGSVVDFRHPDVLGGVLHSPSPPAPPPLGSGVPNPIFVALGRG